MMLASIATLERGLSEAAAKFGVPGVSVAVFYRGRIHRAVAGVVNAQTAIATTTDSLFQIGSVTKPCVAAVVMKLAEQGLIDLAAPVRTYLPDLQFQSGPAPDNLVVRQLLSHTSGIDGDFFIDTGPGDDCLEKYVARFNEVPLICEPGSVYSYCNAGFSLLAHISEKATGKVWDALLREQLFVPAGMTRSFTLAEDALSVRVACGHMPADAEGKYPLVPFYPLPRALGPAGFSLMTTPTDLIAFGRNFLDVAGHRVLSAKSVDTMLMPQVTLPDHTYWGLGWKLQNWSGERVVSHDGGTIGQAANLWMLPRRGLIFAQCANGGRSAELHRALMLPILEELGVREPAFAMPGNPVALDLPSYEGRFENIGITLTFTRTGEKLALHAAPKHPSPPMNLVLTPLDRERMVATMDGMPPVVMAFADFDAQGRPQRFYAGRQHKRVN